MHFSAGSWSLWILWVRTGQVKITRHEGHYLQWRFAISHAGSAESLYLFWAHHCLSRRLWIEHHANGIKGEVNLEWKLLCLVAGITGTCPDDGSICYCMNLHALWLEHKITRYTVLDFIHWCENLWAIESYLRWLTCKPTSNTSSANTPSTTSKNFCRGCEIFLSVRISSKWNFPHFMDYWQPCSIKCRTHWLPPKPNFSRGII